MAIEPFSRINADFSQRVVVATHDMPWIASPQAGVERRMLDRMGGEVAIATSVVRYKPACNFPAHEHSFGEEFLVLEGVFCDEHGRYPVGTYVRNPPGSRHSPYTEGGCTILVKLRQMVPSEIKRVVIDTAGSKWMEGGCAGHSRLVLYESDATLLANRERVAMEKLEQGVQCPESLCTAGEEIFVLSGLLEDDHAVYTPGTWIRNPGGYRHRLKSVSGALYWVKRGHLPYYDNDIHA